MAGVRERNSEIAAGSEAKRGGITCETKALTMASIDHTKMASRR